MSNLKKEAVNGLIARLSNQKTKKSGFISNRKSEEIIVEIKRLFYPSIKSPVRFYFCKKQEINNLFDLVNGQIKAALIDGDKDKSENLTRDFFNILPSIKELLDKDLEFFLSADPAASGINEVVSCYPGFHAILIYRLAHALYRLNVPLLPRVMTEIAHKITGIDIHPAAQIGEYFFIDHGTGVVIGETTVIGNRVKIYQGVTLGALSLKNTEKLKGIKRHPTVRDDVTVYANATVLGGATVISEGKTVPANAFIVKSI